MQQSYVICFDTLCQGYQPIINEDNEFLFYETEEAAQSEIDDDSEFYEDCFVCPVDEIGRKEIYYVQ
jgi:hypothetical protein